MPPAKVYALHRGHDAPGPPRLLGAWRESELGPVPVLEPLVCPGRRRPPVPAPGQVVFEEAVSEELVVDRHEGSVGTAHQVLAAEVTVHEAPSGDRWEAVPNDVDQARCRGRRDGPGRRQFRQLRFAPVDDRREGPASGKAPASARERVDAGQQVGGSVDVSPP
jgi:hypothetical protein